MSKRLLLSQLSYETTEDDLRTLFERIGEVESVWVKRTESGASYGFGNIVMAREEDAETAIRALNGTILHGQPIRVIQAPVQPDAARWVERDESV